jgi:hypothetical protein
MFIERMPVPSTPIQTLTNKQAGGMRPYMDPSRVLDQLLDFVKKADPNLVQKQIEFVVKTFLSGASLRACQQFITTLLGNAKYGPLVGGVLTFLSTLSKTEPLADGTLVAAANHFLDFPEGFNSQRLKTFTKIAHERLNPRSISNGNCGNISSAILFNSFVSKEFRFWSDASSNKMLLENIRNQGGTVTSIEYRTSRDSNGTILQTDIDRIYNAVAEKLSSNKIVKLSQLNGISPSAKYPNVPISKSVNGGKVQQLQENWTESGSHSVNLVRLTNGQTALFDVQRNEMTVGEENVKAWLKNHTSFVSRVNVKFILHSVD